MNALDITLYMVSAILFALAGLGLPRASHAPQLVVAALLAWVLVPLTTLATQVHG